MSEQAIVVLAAMPEEVRTLCRRRSLARVSGSTPRWRGKVAGRQVEVIAGGVGTVRARTELRAILESVAPEAVICVGIAGALSAELAVADLLVAECIVPTDTGGPPVAVPNSPWFDRASALPRVRVGTLLTAPGVVASAADKRDLVARFGLDHGPAAVDMESHVWSSLAREAGLPFVVVRAVSDLANEDLPLDLNCALREDGSISRARVALAALGKPSSWAGLWSLRDRVKVCSRALEQALLPILG